MTGDTQDIVGRLRSVLPGRWFPLTAPGSASTTPILDGLLNGLASAWSWLYGMISYANRQTRLATATDVWLDLIALDFFGFGLQRAANEPDSQYRARIQANLLQPKSTRAAVAKAITTLTGKAPTIFEPANTSDTGGYSLGGVGYGVAGGYGNLSLPFQAFVTAYRPSGGGVATVGGYGNPTLFPHGAGGYGVGAIEYASTSMVSGQVTDAMIQSVVTATMPESTIAWLRISN